MFFTQDDYKKIQAWLTKNSVKDTEFNEAIEPLNGNETITLVQNGHNVKASLQDFVSQLFLLGVSDFLNVSERFNEKYISLSEAIKLIPFKSRKTGQVITFLDENGEWKLYQFQGERVNQWNNTTLWIDILQAISVTSNIVPDEEDITGIEQEDKTVLKFKDKAYNKDDYSGLGRVYLRKNITTVTDYESGCEITTNLLTQNMIGKENTIYIIQYDYNLNGQTIVIPENCVLEFDGGSLRNGKVILNNSYIISEKQIFADDVRVEGSLLGTVNIEWFEIFYDKVVDNSRALNEALSLAANSTSGILTLRKNSVIWIDCTNVNNKWATSPVRGKVEIKSNTTFDLNGSILKCIPNDQFMYAILYCINSENIVIKNGTLYGDKDTHLNDEGEWGYGVAFSGVRNFKLLNLNCNNCFGDGINLQVRGNDADGGVGDGDPTSEKTLSTHCVNGLIENCVCDGNYRQGCSIEGAINITVKNSTFSNTEGTNPQAGIDIEPYRWYNVCYNIEIDNCKLYNNLRGIANLSLFENDNAELLQSNCRNIRITNCKFDKNRNIDLDFSGLDDVYIYNCTGGNVSSNYPYLYAAILKNLSNEIVFDKCELSKVITNKGAGVGNINTIKIRNSIFQCISGSCIEPNASNPTVSYEIENCKFYRETNSSSVAFIYIPSVKDGFSIKCSNCEFDMPEATTNQYMLSSKSVQYDNCKFNNIGMELQVSDSVESNDINITNCKFITSNSIIWDRALFNFNSATTTKPVNLSLENTIVFDSLLNSNSKAIISKFSNRITINNLNIKNLCVPSIFMQKLIGNNLTVTKIEGYLLPNTYKTELDEVWAKNSLDYRPQLDSYLNGNRVINSINKDEYRWNGIRWQETRDFAALPLGLGYTSGNVDPNPRYATIKIKPTSQDSRTPMMWQSLNTQGHSFSLVFYSTDTFTRSLESALYKITESIQGVGNSADVPGRVELLRKNSQNNIYYIKVNKNLRKDDDGYLYIDLFARNETAGYYGRFTIWDEVARCDASSYVESITYRDFDETIDGVDNANYINEYSSDYIETTENYLNDGLIDPRYLGVYDSIREGASLYLKDEKRRLLYNGEEWVDYNGNSIKINGFTKDRPTTAIKSGFQYFDTTLNKPIWWTGSNWVDATGATV